MAQDSETGGTGDVEAGRPAPAKRDRRGIGDRAAATRRARSGLPPLDVIGLETAYRAGILTWDEMCDRFKVSAKLIAAHAKKGQWTRSLGSAVRASAENRLMTLAAHEAMETASRVQRSRQTAPARSGAMPNEAGDMHTTPSSQNPLAMEQDSQAQNTEQGNPDQGRQIDSARLSSPQESPMARADLTRRNLIEAAAAQTALIVAGHRETTKVAARAVHRLFERMDEAAQADDKWLQLLEDAEIPEATVRAIKAAMSLGKLAGVARDLSQAIRNLFALERQAYGLTDDDKGSADDGRVVYDVRFE